MFLSLILRFVYFACLSYFSLWIGIGVAMAFDSGFSALPSALAIGYIFTFLPALLLTFIPLSVITKPPKLLKIWYIWATFTVVLLFVFRLYSTGRHVVDYGKQITQGPTSASICIQTKTHHATELKAFIEVAGPNKQFMRIGSGQSPIGNNQRCTNWGLSMNPMSIRTYIASDANKFSATEDDKPSEPITIQMTTGKPICVEIVEPAEASQDKSRLTMQRVACVL